MVPHNIIIAMSELSPIVLNINKKTTFAAMTLRQNNINAVRTSGTLTNTSNGRMKPE